MNDLMDYSAAELAHVLNGMGNSTNPGTDAGSNMLEEALWGWSELSPKLASRIASFKDRNLAYKDVLHRNSDRGIVGLAWNGLAHEARSLADALKPLGEHRIQRSIEEPQ